MQHRFTRMVPGLKGLDYGGRLERLNSMTLEERRNQSDLVELFKISKGLPCHGIHSSMRTIPKEQEVIR